MKQMRYRGFGRREISAADFARQGVKSKDIAADQGEVIEVNDSVAAWLNEYEAADWQEISEKEAARMQKEAEAKAAKEEAFEAAQEEARKAEALRVEQEAGIQPPSEEEEE